MRLRLATALPVPAECAWELVQTSALLEHVAAPVMRFVPVEPATLPAVWSDGTYRVRPLLFGLLPLGHQWIVIGRPAVGAGFHRLRDNGRGSLARRWDHLITIEPAGADGCRYTDEVEVEAGVLTPFVWLFAQLFYRHRQRRWRALAARQGAGPYRKAAA